jgi:hypothetical protein
MLVHLWDIYAVDMSSVADGSEVHITSILMVKMPVVGAFLCIYIYVCISSKKTMRHGAPSGAIAKHRNINFNENLLNGSQNVSCRQPDGQTEMW